MSSAGYLRFPTISADTIGFVAEDDVWLAPLDGGRAWRVTADGAPVSRTRFSPDGTRLAFLSGRDGAPEVHVVGADGGASRRLTHWGEATTRVIGWADDDRILAVTAAGQPFRARLWAYAVPVDGSPAERLPYGPVSGVAARPDGVLVLGVDENRRSAASWKRYRGGTAGKLWVDPDGGGRFQRLLADLDGQLENPTWIGDRLAFLSDHEGWGNVYSCRPDGSDLRRHTDHGDRYARELTGDGGRLVYQSLGDLWLLDGPDAETRRLDVPLSGPRAARRPRPLEPGDRLNEIAADADGRATAVEVSGTIHWLTSRDGPSRAIADTPGVRARLPRVLGVAGKPAPTDSTAGTKDVEKAPAAPVRVAWVTDAAGDDALEIAPVDGSAPARRIAAGEIGRVLSLAAAPDGSALAVATHDGRVLLVDTTSGAIRTVSATDNGDSSGLVFSPDSRWLAWSQPGPASLRQILLAPVDPAGPVIEVTALRFTDTDPAFTLDGKHLAFLSARTFDPIYDEHVFDMAFPPAVRPYLVPLRASTPSPFDPAPDGRPTRPSDGDDDDKSGPVEVDVDAEGLPYRIVPVPVAAGRYSGLLAARDGLLWFEEPLTGVLGEGQALGDDRPRPRLRRYDLRKRRALTLVDGLDEAAVTGDGKRLVVRDNETLRIVPADRSVQSDDDPDPDTRVDVDLRRLRVTLDPGAEWRQMFDETGRLMRDHFWIADFAGVDWQGVLDRYRPLVDRLGSRDDLSALIWEVHGELGASHAYESPPERPVDSARRVGHLGADLARGGDGTWRIAAVIPGESSAQAARSPLVAPGVDVHAGDAILAVDGRPVDPVTGPGPLLAGTAGVAVELTVRPADGGDARRVVVVPLGDERPLRYHAWVAGRRAAVHAATGGRVGYLHIPDMMANGWAQLHRDLRVEVAREALVVDVRDNGGGHVSELVLEQLSRTVRAWEVVRHGAPQTWPTNSPRGPLVAIANENAGSDGDIVTNGFKLLGLGPVVGTRTWGGVIGIDSRYHLVDGTRVTQPRYAFWFTGGSGWGVENYGVDPDVEVPIAPQDWAAGADPQLDTAVRLALEAIETRPPATPPDPATRPSNRPPELPPRSPR